MLRAVFIALSESRSLRGFAERSRLGQRTSARFVAGKEVADAIRAAGHKSVIFHSSMQKGIEELLRAARPGDAILTIGAGNVSRAPGELAVLLGARVSLHHAH